MRAGGEVGGEGRRRGGEGLFESTRAAAGSAIGDHRADAVVAAKTRLARGRRDHDNLEGDHRPGLPAAAVFLLEAIQARDYPAIGADAGFRPDDGGKSPT